jgi:hypothetical protein
VLLGTTGFWQGGMCRGSLQNVIVVKLAFAVPDEPVIERGWMRSRSRAAIRSWNTRAEAIIKLKQDLGG